MKKRILFWMVWFAGISLALACNAVAPPTPTPIPPAPTLIPTATLTPTPAPTDTPEPSPTPQRTILYQEDFSEDSGAWETGMEVKDGGNIVKTIADGKYVVNLSSTAEYFVSLIDVPDFSGKDFVLSLDFTVVDATFSDISDNLWLSFDVRTSDPYYYSFTFFMDEYRLLYSKSWDANEDLILWDWTKFDALNLEPGVTNNLQFEANGTTLALYVNGEKINSTTDDSLDRAGGVDFTVLLSPANETVTVSFDNVIIFSP